jgi:hypothetical protein
MLEEALLRRSISKHSLLAVDLSSLDAALPGALERKNPALKERVSRSHVLQSFGILMHDIRLLASD